MKAWHRKDQKRGWVRCRVIWIGRYEYMLRVPKRHNDIVEGS